MQSANFSLRTTIGFGFTLIWWILTAIYYKTVMHAYATTYLPMALLTAYSIFFGAIIVFLSILISKSDTGKTQEHIIGLRNLSIGIAILLIANISTYLTSGLLQSLAIYYQLWSTPASMLAFYSLFNDNMLLAFNPKP